MTSYLQPALLCLALPNSECPQGMVNQRPGVLLDSLVGAPEHVCSVQGCVVYWYLRRLDEVSAVNSDVAANAYYSCQIRFHTFHISWLAMTAGQQVRAQAEAFSAHECGII